MLEKLVENEDETYMKRQMKKIGINEIISIGIIILLIIGFVSFYRDQEKSLYTELFTFFVETIQKEKEQQIEMYKGNYDPLKSPNDLPGEEKRAWCVQDYITKHRDPSRHLLDSIFRDILQKQNIDVKMAIRCIRSGAIIDTSADSLFYKKATPLKPVVYRIDNNKEKNITLQAYVDVPVRTILGRIGWFWVISFFLFIILVVGCGIYFKKLREKIEKIIRLLRSSSRAKNELIQRQKVELAELQAQKRKTELISQQQTELIKQKQDELAELQVKVQNTEFINKQQAELIEQKEAELFTLQNEVIPLKPEQKLTWSALPYGLYFNEKQGLLHDDNGLTVNLKNTPLRLFCAFVNAKDYKLSYEDICIAVLARTIKNGVSQSDRENVSTVIYRLKKQLNPFSCIQIYSLRDTGYQMVFSTHKNDSI